jgi:hypothetical protein
MKGRRMLAKWYGRSVQLLVRLRVCLFFEKNRTYAKTNICNTDKWQLPATQSKWPLPRRPSPRKTLHQSRRLPRWPLQRVAWTRYLLIILSSSVSPRQWRKSKSMTRYVWEILFLLIAYSTWRSVQQVPDDSQFSKITNSTKVQSSAKEVMPSFLLAKRGLREIRMVSRYAISLAHVVIFRLLEFSVLNAIFTRLFNSFFYWQWLVFSLSPPIQIVFCEAYRW